MTGARSIRQVSVEVVYDNGEKMLLIHEEPSPQGSNPRFIWQQMGNAMDSLKDRLRTAADWHGAQIESNDVASLYVHDFEDGSQALVTLYKDGTAETSLRLDPSYSWGPPVPMSKRGTR